MQCILGLDPTLLWLKGQHVLARQWNLRPKGAPQQGAPQQGASQAVGGTATLAGWLSRELVAF